jgi:hypothetical protein
MNTLRPNRAAPQHLKTLGAVPPPCNLDAERSVLGAVLLDNPSNHIVFSRLASDDFLLGEHQAIFEAMRGLVAAGIPVDLITLTDRLDTNGKLTCAGGPAYAARLLDGVPRISHVEHYVEIVREKAILRRIARLAEKTERLAWSANGDGQDVLAQLQNLGESICGIVSAHVERGVGQKRKLTFVTGAEVAAKAPESVPWLVRGFVARGAITELSAKVKAGKTTFATHLVRAVLEGRPFLGAATCATPVVYLTEQTLVSFRVAMQRSDLVGRPDVSVLCWNETVGMAWPEIVGEVLLESQELGAGLLGVDTIAQFAGLTGDAENNSGDALEAMHPLQQMAAKGLAVLMLRHERKSGGEVGDSGRGSSAFAGAVDVVLSLRRAEGNSRKSVRVLHALSRFSETPPELMVELTESGFVALGSTSDVLYQEARDSIVSNAPTTEAEAVELGDLNESGEVRRATLQRIVKELLKAGNLRRVGKGKRGEPYRYFRAVDPDIVSAQPSYLYGQKRESAYEF